VMNETGGEREPVELVQPQHSPYRTCTLLGLALHQEGYPVQVTPYMSPSGCYWRCGISLDNHKSTTYSSSCGWDLFDCGDCQTLGIKTILPKLKNVLGIDERTERTLWTGKVEAETLLWVDWYERMMEVTAPKGFWSLFSDYGGFELFEAPEVTVPEWKDVACHWKAHTTSHDFLLEPMRQQLASAAKKGSWTTVERIIREHRGWVNLPRPHYNDPEKFTGYTPLHQAAYHGSKDAVLILLSLNADIRRTCKDGTAADVARKYKHTHLLPLLEGKEFAQ